MSPNDEEKTSFITDRGLYYYKAMLFNLKNASTTYQRLVNQMFKQRQISRNMEVYVNDLLVKSKKPDQHLKNLHKAFAILRQYQMKLNPLKCAFGVESGKFLGFIVPKAIVGMPSPHNLHEVQRLIGRVEALNCFITRLSNRCCPFFKVLIKAQEWDTAYDEAFVKLKRYLAQPPLFSQTKPSENLTVYLAMLLHVVSAILVRTTEEGQHPVYYMSCAFYRAKARYP